MRQTLEKLQNMPEHKKRLTALLGASIITGVIFAVWLTVTIETIPASVATAKNEVAKNTPSPVEALKTNVAGAYVGFQNAISSLKEQFNNLDLGGDSASSANETNGVIVDSTGQTVKVPDQSNLIFTK